MKKLPLLATDSGRVEAGFPLERRDCTVRALSAAGSLPYAVAHDLMKVAGRKDRHAGHTSRGLREAKLRGLLDYHIVTIPDAKVVEVEDRRSYFGGCKRRYLYPTLATILPLLNPSESYIMHTRTHAFAVVRGVLYDQSKMSMRARIQDVWLVRPIKAGNESTIA